MELRSMVFYEAIRTFLGPILSLHYRLKSEGEYNVPGDGAAIIASNHRCYLDPYVLAHAVTRFINFAAGSHLYGVIPGTDIIFKLMGFFPMHIYGGKDSDKSLDKASQLLSRGELVGIFPEGIESFMNINQVSKITSFKTGFVKLALDNRVPIIPAAIVALEEKKFINLPAMLVKAFVKHPRAGEGLELITYRKATCRIGRPIDLSPYYDEKISKVLLDNIAGKVRKIIVKLYNGEDLDRFLTGETPFDFATDPV